MIKIFNTLTKQKEEFIPRDGKKAQMFVCGPTVYDYIHIGNARTFVFFDVVAKYLRHQGYDVDYIQNITDIDDKIINKAAEANREALDWAKEYQEKFEEDMKALGVTSPRYIPATKHIKEVIAQVQTLIDKGFAYEIKGDGWYYDLSKFPEYGKLSGRTAQGADDAVSRIDENNKKKNAGDFCLWKFSKADEPSWPSDLGAGRPGWHIEDTAITENYFGPQYDLHGGGQDLIFPHHEAEITQQESASGKAPFVKYWMHVAFLVNSEKKMSKSLGNFETARELLKKYPKEVLRFYLLANHYRSPLDYSDDMFKQSVAAVSRIREFRNRLALIKPSLHSSDKISEVSAIIEDAKNKVFSALDDDFNTTEALGILFTTIKNLNAFFDRQELSVGSVGKIISLLNFFGNIFGIIPTDTKYNQDVAPKEITELVSQREKMRESKNYSESDRIRAQIEDLGWKIEDTLYGPLVVKK